MSANVARPSADKDRSHAQFHQLRHLKHRLCGEAVAFGFKFRRCFQEAKKPLTKPFSSTQRSPAEALRTPGFRIDSQAAFLAPRSSGS